MTTRRNMFTTAAFALAASAAALPAYAVQNPEAGAAQTAVAQTEPSVMVFNQKADGKTIKLSYAYMPKDGYAAILASGADGKPTGEPIAHVALKTGDHRDVKLTFDTELKVGASYWAALYTEGGNDGKFDANDKPLWQLSQLPYENKFTIE